VQRCLIEEGTGAAMSDRAAPTLRFPSHPRPAATHDGVQVMEYASGGDFFTLLSRDGAVSEERAVLYIAEIVVALEALHNAGIVYR